jgi:hypothetical protein
MTIADYLRGPDLPSGDDFATFTDGAMRLASQALLAATLVPTVQGGYGSDKRAAMHTINEAADTIRRTLESAKLDDSVLAGAVAEKVRAGIAEIIDHGDYTRAMK